MDVREKLVELLEPHMSGLACEYESGSCELTSCRSCNAKNIADHLIANGITTEQKLEKGQWKWIDLHGDGFETLCCSECGYTEGREYYNFCPNCGARMDGAK